MLSTILRLSLAHVAIGGPSGHAWYNLPSGKVDELQYYVIWKEMPEQHDLYASFEFYWDGTTGYMGSQFHSDGTQILDFAIWDSDSVPGTAQPLGNCERFGGEGNGAHCEVAVSLERGQNYLFRLYKSSQSGRGSTWSCELNGQKFGDIFFDEVSAGSALGQLNPNGVSFNEYFADSYASFDASVGFIGPYGKINGETIFPSDATCDCDDGTSCSPTIDGVGSGLPNVLLYGGPGVPAGSGDIWSSVSSVPNQEIELGNFTILGKAKPGRRPSHARIVRNSQVAV